MEYQTLSPITPICVMSFNRPAYLEKVLQSMREQVGFTLDEKRIYFFQDGAINKFSGIRYAEDVDVKSCVRLFRHYFPYGKIFQSPDNIGVALNFARAEAFVFDELGADCAFFFEDDLVLGQAYLKTLSQISEVILQDGRIGYFSATGNPQASLEDQVRRPALLTPMAHNWAFGLTKKQYDSSKTYVDQYLSIVGNVDYRKRDSNEIKNLLQGWGVGFPGTSQDVIKSIASYLTGYAKLKTFTCYGKYIGEVGLHSTKELFDKMGFRDAVFVNEDICKIVNVPDSDFNHAREIAEKYSMSDISKK